MTVDEVREADSWLRGDWMQTNSGRRFYPLDPRPAEIDARDIAHALSLLCRYGGHVDRFYSVAEHCVLMSEAVAPENALAALLHDATEAYVCDVPRPLKRQLVGYREIEDRLWFVIAEKYSIDVVLPAEVKEADNRILLTERAALMRHAERWTVDDGYTPLPVTVTGWSPPDAERFYLDRLEELVSSRACIFLDCVATWKHSHGGFPGGYDNPDDPTGPPIEFEGDDPDPGAVRDYNGAALRGSR